MIQSKQVYVASDNEDYSVCWTESQKLLDCFRNKEQIGPCVMALGQQSFSQKQSLSMEALKYTKTQLWLNMWLLQQSLGFSTFDAQCC